MSRSLRAEKLEAMRLLAEHHLEDVRFSRKGRDVVALKHSVFGWISPTRYYALQHGEELLRDLLPKFVEGGYRLKEALAMSSIEVLGFGVPIGAPLYATGVAKGVANLTSKDPHLVQLGVLELLGVFLPFGEPILLLALAIETAQLDIAITNAGAGIFGSVGNGIVQAFVGFG